MYEDTKIDSDFFLNITSRDFQYNQVKATIYIVQVEQYSNKSKQNRASKSILSLSLTKFHCNKADKAIWDVKSNKLVLSYYILYKNIFEVNSVKNGSALIINNFTKVIMKGMSLFQRNKIRYNIIVLRKTPSVFKGNIIFINNKANYIIIMHKYATLKDGTVITITNNTYFYTKINSAVLSFEKSFYNLGPCPLQFDYTDMPYKNNLEDITVAIQITYNTGYNTIIKGSRLNSCYWVMNSTYEYTPGSVYQKAVYIDKVETSLNDQSMCICKENNVDCVVDQLGQVMTGGSIIFSLKTLKPMDKVVVYIDDRITNKPKH